jgi:hypothetical protein
MGGNEGSGRSANDTVGLNLVEVIMDCLSPSRRSGLHKLLSTTAAQLKLSLETPELA